MLTGKMGHRRMLITGLVLYTLISLVHHPVSNPTPLGLIRACHGLSCAAFFTVGSVTIFTFMPLHSQGLGINATMAGIIIATVYICPASLEVSGGKLSGKIGRRAVILLGLTSKFRHYDLDFFYELFSRLITAAIFYGVGMVIAMPAVYVLAADLPPLEMRGLSMGMSSSFLHGGLAFGPTIMGIVASMSNYATVFRACSLSLILGIIVVVSLTGKRRQAHT
jgi:MFS family permease